MATFSGIQHIGEKVLNSVPSGDILSCRIICKSWKQILDNPKFWLKKLNKIGQNKTSYEDCLKLLRKSEKAGLPQAKITFCLIMRYILTTGISSKYTFTKNHYKKGTFSKGKDLLMKKFLLRLPMLYFAMIPREPDLKLIDFLIKSNPNVFQPIRISKEIKYCRGKFEYNEGHTYSYNIHTNCVDPLRDLIEGGHNLEVIKAVAPKLLPGVKCPYYKTPLNLAVLTQDLEICKYFAQYANSEDVHEENMADFFRHTPITKAIELGNLEILKLFVSKTQIPNKVNSSDSRNQTPLFVIVLDCLYRSGRNHKNCIEMVKVILPNIKNLNVRRSRSWLDNETVLDKIINNWDKSPCMIEILKVIAPFYDTKDLEVWRREHEFILKNGECLPQAICEILKSTVERKRHFEFETEVN